MKLLRYISFLVLMVVSTMGMSQQLTAKAHALYSAKNYDSAQVYIDSAITTVEKYNSQTWQLRGLIYRKLETAETPQYRDIAIESFVQAKAVDSTGTYTEKINEYLYNTIIRYYNEAVTHLNEGNYSESERHYLLFKEKFLALIDPSRRFDNEDLEYYNALGAGYTRQLNQVNGKEYEIVFALAVNALGKVLAIDSMNYQANLNTAVIYYNRGASLMENADDNLTIDQLMENIETSNNLFLHALPMMKRAYVINPESPDVIEGLAGIYYSLNDDENWMIFQTKLDKINLPKFLEAFEKNPNDREVVKQLVRIYSSTLKDDTQYLKFKAILDQLGG